jgi:dihydrofolate reductase
MEIIVAASMPSWGIGNDGSIPWKIWKDMERFTQITTGHIVIMGRKTYFSLPKRFRPLPNRVNIVVSSNNYGRETDLLFVQSFFEAVEFCNLVFHPEQKVFVIGGAKLITEALEHPNVSIVHLTKITKPSYPCDVFIPNIDQMNNWEQIDESEEHVEGLNRFQFVTYIRSKSN